MKNKDPPPKRKKPLALTSGQKTVQEFFLFPTSKMKPFDYTHRPSVLQYFFRVRSYDSTEFFHAQFPPEILARAMRGDLRGSKI
jgi:hypothetical protein